MSVRNENNLQTKMTSPSQYEALGKKHNLLVPSIINRSECHTAHTSVEQSEQKRAKIKAFIKMNKKKAKGHHGHTKSAQFNLRPELSAKIFSLDF